ncbi:Transport-associated protein (fragment) [Verrucomicrobia bacterium]
MRNLKSAILVGSVGALVATTGLVTGCASWHHSGDERTATQKVNDYATARRVKKDLDNAPVYKFPDVGVTAYNGQVQLYGFVDTDDQKRQAENIARHTVGVTQVVDDITLKPGTPTPTGRAYNPNNPPYNQNQPNNPPR